MGISVDLVILLFLVRLLGWCSGKEFACQCKRCRRCEFTPWVGKILWSRKWQPTPVFLPGKSHGQRSLAGYSLIGSQRLGHDSTHTHTHTQNPLPGTEREIPLVNVNFSYQRVTLTWFSEFLSCLLFFKHNQPKMILMHIL